MPSVYAKLKLCMNSDSLSYFLLQAVDAAKVCAPLLECFASLIIHKIYN